MQPMVVAVMGEAPNELVQKMWINEVDEIV